MSTPIVNSHIHTPYSFACFESVRQAVDSAAAERIGVLGISDFNTVEGYSEFGDACKERRIYPAFGIEFIAFAPEDKRRGFRWNDPKNPGILYFCGKALDYPSSFPQDTRNVLADLWKATQDHIWRVVERVNEYMGSRGIPVRLEYGAVRSAYAKFTVRERHVAKAVYHEFERLWPDTTERMNRYRTLFGDKGFGVDPANSVHMQNEIRDRLLKAGRPAFVEEDISAFLGLVDVTRLILAGGGIPCYPVLIDDKSGLTEYENDVDRLAAILRERAIHMVEFIPLRNTLDHLKRYVLRLHELGFLIVFGTEHNTPQMYSMVPRARGGTDLGDELAEIGYRGACVLAAHQRSHRIKHSGFVNGRGERIVTRTDIEEFVRLGDREIREQLEKAAP